MPGISLECDMAAHAQCSIGQDCRCQCHPWTQALMRKGPAKPDPKGGIKRKVRQKVAEIAAQVEAEAPTELYNTCPKCKERAKPTDQFCRKDGARLTLGRACERCASPCEESDAFCWQCGWKIGDPLPVQETEILPMTPEKVKQRLREKLIEKGYAVPDTLV